ncbi:MAG: FtsX-like permease family protein [Hyphomicrobiaceae bacterium]
MTSVAAPLSAIAQAAPPRARLRRLFNLAIRDLRGNFRGFWVFLACLALGVAAIASVGTIADAVRGGLDAQGRVLLGGDVAVSRMHVRASAEERTWLAEQGSVSEIASLRAMARKPGGSGLASALVEIKAVDAAYPLTGTLSTATGEDAKTLLAQGSGAIIDPLLAERLGLGLGDTLILGDGEVQVRGLVGQEPDKLAAQAAFGPRVLVSLDTLIATGLAKPGSLTRWSYRVLAADGARYGEPEFKDFRTRLTKAFADGGFTVTDRRDPAPGARRAVDRLGQFLTLVGLATLLIGGAGVANAVSTYLEKKTETIAVFRALGASSRDILVIYHIEILLLAGLGIGIGLLAGTLLPMLGNQALGHLLPFPLAIGVSPMALGPAALYGLLVALLFAFWPLGRTERVSAALLFREKVARSGARPRFLFVAAMLVALAAIAAIALLTADDPRLAAYFLGGMAAVFAIFLGLGAAIPKLVAALPRPRRTELKLAQQNIAGPGSLARSAMLSLGIGLSLLVTIALVDRSLVAELETGLPDKAPAYFFLDIGKDELEPLTAALKSSHPDAIVSTAPMLRGRLIALKGAPVEEIKAPPEAEWVLTGDRGLTFSDEPPARSTVMDGSWWPKGYQGEPLVSFDVELARQLGLAVGDTLTVNVLGRNVTARIANLRTVDWDRLAINFVMIFSPNTLAKAPYNQLATLSFPAPQPLDEEARLIQSVSQQFPAVTAIRVKDAIETVAGVLGQVMTAIRATASITLLAGALVLAGAMVTAERRRIYEAVLLKTLGARRRLILVTHLLEYLVLALIAGAIASGLGTLAAFIVTREVMDLPFTFSLPAVLLALGLAIAMVVGFGLIGSARVLAQRPVPYLRSE